MCYGSSKNYIFLSVVISIAAEKNNVSEVNFSGKYAKMEGFIVGGEQVAISLFPHAVCLLTYPVFHSFCGASVLNQRIILTAAHCVDSKMAAGTWIEAFAGHENLGMVKIMRRISRQTVHERYDPETTHNDIALLFLDHQPLPLGENRVPIKRVIIRQTFPIHEKVGQVCGWGYVNDVTKESSTILKATKQKIIPLDECQETYFYEWLPGMLCGGDADSLTNRPSRGDSGGGLMARDQQIGIVSFVVGSEPGLVFYTNVSFYYKWIVDTANNKICEYH